jgi:hypothetical protein
MTQLLTPDQLEARLRRVGAERYHSLHPFHELLHTGKLNFGQVQAWALNRFYYQPHIPIKDAALLARLTSADTGAPGASVSSTMTAPSPAKAALRAGSSCVKGSISISTMSSTSAAFCRQPNSRSKPMSISSRNVRSWKRLRRL